MKRCVNIRAAHRFLVCGDNIVVVVSLAVVFYRTAGGQRTNKLSVNHAVFTRNGTKLCNVKRPSDVSARTLGDIFYNLIADLVLHRVLVRQNIERSANRRLYLFGGKRLKLKNAAAGEHRIVDIKIGIFGGRGYEGNVPVFNILKQNLLLLFGKILNFIQIKQHAACRLEGAKRRNYLLNIRNRSGGGIKPIKFFSAAFGNNSCNGGFTNA